VPTTLAARPQRPLARRAGLAARQRAGAGPRVQHRMADRTRKTFQAWPWLSAAYRVPLYRAVDGAGRLRRLFRRQLGQDLHGRRGPAVQRGVATSWVFGARCTCRAGTRVDQRVSAGPGNARLPQRLQHRGLAAGRLRFGRRQRLVAAAELAYTAQTGGDIRVGASVSLHHNLGLGGSHTRQADFEAVRAGAQTPLHTAAWVGPSVVVPVPDWGTLALRLFGAGQRPAAGAG
jgi:hypothetical protein